jgi:hemerythrin-like domain-containing protein
MPAEEPTMTATDTKSTTTRVTDILRNEHEILLDVLLALETISEPAARGEILDMRSAREILDFLRGFGDRCHHGKEEQLFFPALAARGLPREVGPLAVMMGEHDQGRGLIARMAGALADAEQKKPGAAAGFAAAAAAYVELLRDHIDKENGVLFPMGDGMLSEENQVALLHAFETFEHADMGAGVHERFLEIASGLSDRLGIARTHAAPKTAHVCCGRGTKCS